MTYEKLIYTKARLMWPLIDIPVGSVVVLKASVAISRNVDFDFVNPENCTESAYYVSKLVCFIC